MAAIGDLVVKLSANTKSFNSGIAKSQVALQHLTTTAAKTVNVVSDLNTLRLDSHLADNLDATATSMTELQTATYEINQALLQFEQGLDLAASSTSLLASGISAATGASGLMVTTTAAMSRGLTTAVVTAVALRQTTGTLAYAFGLAADGARTLMIPVRMLGNMIVSASAMALKALNLLLTPFRMLWAVMKMVASGAWAIISPFMGLAGTAIRLYISFRAFIMQLKILKWIFSMMPPKMKAIVIGLMALGAASRAATAAMNSLGIVGRAAGRAISLLTLPIRAIISPVKTARESVAALNTTLQKTVIVAGQAATAIKGKLTGSLKSMAGSFAGSLKAIVGFGASALPLAAVGAVKLAADAETLAMKMKVLTGSTATAADIMKKLDAFAADTPFQKMEVGQAAQLLLSFGSASATVFDELRMIGDVAAATGTPLTEMAELYGKAQVQGRLFAEDINQLTGRGIPIIQELAKQLGVTDSEVKELVKDGKVGFPEMQRGLAAMVGPGGKFGGMMSELSTTTAGKFSTFVDKVLLLGTSIGNVLLPYANQLLDWSSQMVGNVDGIANAFSGAIKFAADWFVQTQAFVIDVGTVVGVVVGNMSNIWSAMFEEIPKFASAAFTWLTDNAGTVIDNIGIMVQNLYAKLNSAGMQLGEEIAYQLGLSDEVLNIAEAQQKPMKPLAPIKMPEVGKQTKEILGDINEALDINAKQRAAVAVAEAAKQQTQIDKATGISTSFIKPGGTGATDSKKEAGLAGATKSGSQEAYSLLAQAYVKSKDPAVKATQDQTKALMKPLGQMAAAATGGLAGLGGVLLVESI